MGKREKHPQRRSKKTMLLGILGLIAAAFVLRFAVLLFVLGMLPTFVANYVDRSTERNAVRIIAACNFAGVLPFIATLWQEGISSSNVSDMMMEPHVWLVMYGAAGFGWLLIWFFPQAVQFVLELLQTSKVASLRRKQQQIVDEWGVQVEAASRKHQRNTDFEEKRKKERAKA